MSTEISTFLTVESNGAVTLPDELVKGRGLDRPGAQVRLGERADGVIELVPLGAVPADQLWFWTKEWQQMEREADEDISAGRVRTFESAEDFLDSLRDISES